MKSVYVVRWKAPCMPAPSFWYYIESANAEKTAHELTGTGHTATVAPVQVADSFICLDEVRR